MRRKAESIVVKNKEQTKRKLIDAVGEIVKTDGFVGLGVNKIAKVADVDKKLIYRYFGNVNFLIESYVVQNDYWMAFPNKFKSDIDQNCDADIEMIVSEILQNNFRFFYSEVEMQRLVLWEISTESPLMKGIHNARENMAKEFLQLTDPCFKGSEINFRAIVALLVGGIFYTVLHTCYNGGIFCDIDINSEDGKTEIIRTIKQIISWAFQQAGKEKLS